MRKSDYSFMFLAALFITTSAFAESPMFASPKATPSIGHALASGVIDKFIVLGYGVEGGISACAEAAPTGQVENLTAIISQLNAIHPNPQTTAYSVTPVERCSNETVFCTQDVNQCADGSLVGRVPLSCNFVPCSATQ